MSTNKRRATTLLRKYDRMRRDIRQTERDLNEAVTNYGREVGYYGLSKDHFRNMLEQERLNAAAEQDQWEKNNA